MFRRHKEQEPSQADILRNVIEILADLEPKQMDKIVMFAKEHRAYMQKVDSFLSNGPAKIEKAAEELELMDFEESK